MHFENSQTIFQLTIQKRKKLNETQANFNYEWMSFFLLFTEVGGICIIFSEMQKDVVDIISVVFARGWQKLGGNERG